MNVTFTKLAGRYEISVRRDTGHRLAPRGGPGFDPRVPHDVAHLLVEIEDGIRAGVYGRLADATDDGMFWAADPAVKRKLAKKSYVPTTAAAADMARSERLASLTVALWEVSRGHRAADPAWPGSDADSGESPEFLGRLYARYDEFAAHWSALPVGGSMTLHWPSRTGR